MWLFDAIVTGIGSGLVAVNGCHQHCFQCSTRNSYQLIARLSKWILWVQYVQLGPIVDVTLQGTLTTNTNYKQLAYHIYRKMKIVKNKLIFSRRDMV